VSLGYYELKKHKPWLNDSCSELLHESKQAKLQWLQEPSQMDGGNLNNIRREDSRHARNNKRECLKGKIIGFAMISRNKNMIGL
jgi:hypothetical protein